VVLSVPETPFNVVISQRVAPNMLRSSVLHKYDPAPREFGQVKRNFTGVTFWARGYYVSTAGREEKVVQDYIRRQEEQDRRLDQQLKLPDME